MLRSVRALVVLSLLLVVASSASADKPGMRWRDLVQVRKAFSPVLSDDGRWMAVEARPDRGDGEVVFRATKGGGEFSISRGKSPAISADGRFGLALEQPEFEARENAGEDDELYSAGVLLRLADGEITRFERVEEMSFSADGQWLAVRFAAAEAGEVDEAEAGPEVAEPEEPGAEEKDEPRDAGTLLEVLRLADGEVFDFQDILRYAWSETGSWLAAGREGETGEGNALLVWECGEADPVESILQARDNGTWQSLTWAKEWPLLAVVAADATDPEDPVGAELLDYDAAAGNLVVRMAAADLDEGWALPLKNKLRYSLDGQRLFFGLHAVEPGNKPDSEPDSTERPFDFLDVEDLLAKATVDVWQFNDPRIKTHERKTFEERRDHLYAQVVHREGGEVVRLADETLADVDLPESGRVALASDRTPWLKEMTWDGFYRDLWSVDLRTGARTKVATHVQDTVSRSPQGGSVVWFADGSFWIYDTVTAEQRELGAEIGVPFANEDHDYPRAADDYGVGGWLRDDSAVILNDKYDLWMVPVDGSSPVALTQGRGRRENLTWRVAAYDRGPEGLPVDEPILLTGFDQDTRSSSFWRVNPDGSGLEMLRESDGFFSLKAKAEDADRFLFTEEDYDRFPDFHIAGPDFRRPRRLTDLNPQLRDFDLGEAGLVDWLSDDGIPTEGILIKPAGYEEGKRYPVLVYYYRFFTDRLHRFNDPVINHRPSFYIYAGDGYAVFLPDIRFRVGEPGASAAASLLPGVQKIIDTGVADPGAIALHGHSWSGYQTAQIVTLTDLFACAVAGAPVSNMTSAYGGIRYGTGLSRMFQYEKSQSRIGASLWERRDLYIENSPVFFADRINTPLLIEFGDEDEAVPWTQGIELYMAMRRLDKPCVMLQYRGEPHHLKQFPNKLDYSLRMKAFIDAFCKGAPAPDWWSKGVPYEGD